MQGGNVCILHACSLMFLSCTNFMYRTTITLWLEGLRAWGLIGTHQRLGLTRLRHVVGLNDISSAAALRMAYQLWSYRSLSAACIQSLGEKTWSSMTYHQIMYRYVSICIDGVAHFKNTPLKTYRGATLKLYESFRDFPPGSSVELPRGESEAQSPCPAFDPPHPRPKTWSEPRWTTLRFGHLT